MTPLAEALIPVFSNPAGTVLTHPAGYALLRYHGGRWPVAAQAELLTCFGKTLLDHGWHFCINDARLLQALPAEHRQWVSTNWINSSGLRPGPLHMAWIQPAELISRLTAQQMQVYTADQLHYNHFTEENAAHAYVQNQLMLRLAATTSR